MRVAFRILHFLDSEVPTQGRMRDGPLRTAFRKPDEKLSALARVGYLTYLYRDQYMPALGVDKHNSG